MPAHVPFTGSYGVDDVEFLLKPIALEDTPVEVKEALIQSGRKHYSQMLSHESLPTEDYLALFYEALQDNKTQLARHALVLASQIIARRPGGVTLVSLARAGTPIGVVLKHLLKRHFHQDAAHYSVSIIRDVGLDANALRHILKSHGPETLVFVDGWTGKGVISRQLADSLAAFGHTDGINIAPELFVLADLSGSAAVAATSEDYLIPSCILNATVSGLVSRTVYDPERLAADDFHACVFYPHFSGHDQSAYFVTQVLSVAANIGQQEGVPASPQPDKTRLQQQTQHCIDWLRRHYQIRQTHLIKPGIGEATRVLLRREARLLLLKDPDHPATRHLRWLAQTRAVPLETHAGLPYRAVALIKELS